MKTDYQDNTFLNSNEIAKLTGRKIKSLQITMLRNMGIPHFINATGHPIVTRAILEGKKEVQKPMSKWKSNALQVN